MDWMIKQIKPLVMTFAALFILTGIVYPAVVFVIGQVAFPYQANGSLIGDGDKAAGSILIGQQFSDPKYFWPRPSYTANGPYDPMASGGSNYGPTNKKLIDDITNRTAEIKLSTGAGTIPSDLVMGSASGLEPYISLEAALIQAPRIADARGLDNATVVKMVNDNVEKPYMGIVGSEVVNVVKLNLLLDNSKR